MDNSVINERDSNTSENANFHLNSSIQTQNPSYYEDRPSISTMNSPSIIQHQRIVKNQLQTKNELSFENETHSEEDNKNPIEKNGSFIRNSLHAKDAQEIDTQEIDTQEIDTQDLDTQEIDTQDLDTQEMDAQDLGGDPVEPTHENCFELIPIHVLANILSYIPVLDITTGIIHISKQFHAGALERMRSFEVSLLQDDSIPIRNESNRWQSKTIVARTILKPWDQWRPLCSMTILRIQLQHIPLFLNGDPFPTVRELQIIRTTTKIGDRDQLFLSQLPFTIKFNLDIFSRLKTSFPNVEVLEIPHLHQKQDLIDVYSYFPHLKKLSLAASMMKDLKAFHENSNKTRSSEDFQIYDWLDKDFPSTRKDFKYDSFSFQFFNLTELKINHRESNYSFLGSQSMPQFLYVIERCPNLEKIVFHRYYSPLFRLFEMHLNPNQELEIENKMKRDYWKSLAKKSKLREVKIVDGGVDQYLSLYLKYLSTLEKFEIKSTIQNTFNINFNIESKFDEILELVINNRGLKILHIGDRSITSEMYDILLSLDYQFDKLYIRIKQNQRNTNSSLLSLNIFDDETIQTVNIMPTCSSFGIWNSSQLNFINLIRNDILTSLTVRSYETKTSSDLSNYFPNLKKMLMFCLDTHVWITCTSLKILKLKVYRNDKSSTSMLTIHTPSLEECKISTNLLKNIAYLKLLSNQKETLRLQYAISLQEFYYTSPRQRILVLFAKDLKRLELNTPKLSLLMASAHNYSFLDDKTFSNLDRALIMQSDITNNVLELFQKKATSLQTLLFFNCSFNSTQFSNIRSGDYTPNQIYSVDRLIINQLHSEQIDIGELAILMPNIKQFTIQCTTTDENSTVLGLIFASSIWRLENVLLDSVTTNKEAELFLKNCPLVTRFQYKSLIQETTPLTIPNLKKLWLLRVSGTQIKHTCSLPSLFNLEILPLHYTSPFNSRLNSKDIFEPINPEIQDSENLLKKEFTITSPDERYILCDETKKSFSFCPNLEEFCCRGMFTEETILSIIEEGIMKCPSLNTFLFEEIRENIAIDPKSSGELLEIQDNVQQIIGQLKSENTPKIYYFVK